MAKHYINFDEKVYGIHKEVLEPATDALKAHLGTLGSGGGTLELGKEYKFKDIITETDFEAYIAGSDGGVEIPDGRAYILCDAVELVTILIDTSIVYMITIVSNDGKPTTYILNGTAFGVEDGWQSADKTPINAPSIIVAEHANMSADLATTAIFFDLSGNEGDTDITLDGAVYKVDSTKLAPATNSLIAHLETLKGGESGGGVPAFGTNWKFKEKLTVADIEAVIKHYELIEGSCSIIWEDPFGLEITMTDIAELTDNEFSGTVYHVMYDPRKTGMISELCMYFICDASQEAIEALISYGELPPYVDAWVTGGSDMVAMDTPPVIESVPESTGINPEYVAPLFDVAPAGGTLEYGKEYQFKDIITEADCEAYVKNAVPAYSDATSAEYGICKIGEGSFVKLMCMIQNSNIIAWMLVIADTGALYGINANAMGAPIPDMCWVDGDSMQPIDTPTVTLIDGQIGADLATTAVFFDLGGGSGNDGDTKIVINGAEYWVDSAKLADAKRALAEHLKALEDASN